MCCQILSAPGKDQGADCNRREAAGSLRTKKEKRKINTEFFYLLNPNTTTDLNIFNNLPMQKRTRTKKSPTIRRSGSLEAAKTQLLAHLTRIKPLDIDGQRKLLAVLVPKLPQRYLLRSDGKTITLALVLINAGWRITVAKGIPYATLENRRGKARADWFKIAEYARQGGWPCPIETENRTMRRTLGGRVAWEIPSIAKRTKKLDQVTLEFILKMSRHGGWEFSVVDGEVVATLNKSDCVKSISESQIAEYASRGLTLDKIDDYAGIVTLVHSPDGCEQYKAGIDEALENIEDGKNLLNLYALSKAGFHDEAGDIEDILDIAGGAMDLARVLRFTHRFLYERDEAAEEAKPNRDIYSDVLGRNYAPFCSVLEESDTREFIARADGQIRKSLNSDGWLFETITDSATGEMLYLVSDKSHQEIVGVIDRDMAREFYYSRVTREQQETLSGNLDAALGIERGSDDIPF